MNARNRLRPGITAAVLAALAVGCASTGPAPTPTTDAPAANNPTGTASEPSAAAPAVAEVGDAPPTERYWQLGFLLGITEGLDEELLQRLEGRYPVRAGAPAALTELEDLQAAGYRIARPEAILEAVTPLARYRQAAEAELKAARARLAERHPEAVDALDPELVAEEVLLVRSVILDSLERLAAGEDWPRDLVEDYRLGTVRARNELEYVVYARDIEALAERSIDDSTGRLDAFHRMLDDSADTAFLRERVLAAEEMNRQLTEEHREYATRRTVRTLFFLLPAISNFFRYR